MADVDKYLPPRIGPSWTEDVRWYPGPGSYAIRAEATRRLSRWSGLGDLAILGFNCTVIQPSDPAARRGQVGVRIEPSMQMSTLKPLLGLQLADWLVGKREEPPVVTDHYAEDIQEQVDQFGYTAGDIGRLYPRVQPEQPPVDAAAAVAEAELVVAHAYEQLLLPEAA